jgi:hypothetical protein
MRLTVYFRTLCVSVFLASILTPLASRGLTEGPYTYEVANGEATITSVNSDFFNGSLNIPATLGGYPVTQIGDNAFNTWENENITAITIPDTVTYIADWAFVSCRGLNSIAIPNSVTNIGYNIFWTCDELAEITVDPGNQFFSVFDGALYDKEITTLFYVPKVTEGILSIPDKVVYIEYSALQDCSKLTSISISSNVIGSINSEISGSTFQGCINLAEINVSQDNQRYSSADGVLYNKDKTDLIKFPQARTDNVNIPDGVKFIAEYAFESCSGLRELTIPDSVTRLGWTPFQNCTNLTTVVIGSGIVDFQDFQYVFSGCTMLSAIHVNNGNPNFSSLDGVLFNKNQTTLIQYPKGKNGSYTIPNSVTSIGNSAFSSCTALTSVTIPDSVTSIGNSAFGSCTALASVTIPDSVTSIGISAFSFCSSLAVFYVSADNLYYSVDSTYGMLFDKSQATLIKCPNNFFGECILPETVTSIGAYAFETCFHLTTVTAPSSLTSIGDRAFENCSSLESVLFMGNLPSLGDDVFDLWRTPRATVYYLPGTAGWTDTFAGLSAFPYPFEFTVANGCATINAYGGSGNEYLKVPSYIGNHPVTIIGDAAFYGNDDIVILVIPDGVVTIGRAAFAGCTGLETVVLGKDVAEIETRAFYGCTALSKIYARGNAPSPGSSAFTDVPGTLYYLPGSTGWQDTFGAIPTELLPYAYTVNADHIRIDAYLGNSEHITIPESIEGLPVTEIGESAFEGNFNLVSVVIPDSVRHIGEAAFLDCLSLVDITLPNDLTSIGDWAFAGCDSLAALFVNHVQTIGDFAFAFCPSLTEIYFGGYSAPAIGENVFAWTDATLYNVSSSENWPASLGDRPVIRFPFTFSRWTEGIAITGYVGPETNAVVVPAVIAGFPVTVIAPYAFSNWASPYTAILTSITLPDSILRIDFYAFAGCTNLESVTLGSNLESIGEGAFWLCTSLPRITIPSSVTNISSFAFADCSGLTAIDVDGANPVYSSLDGVLFDKQQTSLICFPAGLAECTIPDSVTSIGDGAFSFCTSLTSMTIPDSVTSIGYGAFSGCANLASVTLGAAVANIGDWAFEECTSLGYILCKGAPPALSEYTFGFDVSPTFCYLPSSAADWPPNFNGNPTLCWNPAIQHNQNFGFQSGQFGFSVTGTPAIPVAFETTADLTSGNWTRVTKTALDATGTLEFTDPESATAPTRFYRIAFP